MSWEAAEQVPINTTISLASECVRQEAPVARGRQPAPTSRMLRVGVRLMCCGADVLRLGACNWDQEKWDKTVEYFQRAYDIRSEVYGQVALTSIEVSASRGARQAAVGTADTRAHPCARTWSVLAATGKTEPRDVRTRVSLCVCADVICKCANG